MEYLLTAEEMSQADRRTSEEIGIPSLVLMERAALGVYDEVRKLAGQCGPHPRIAVAAGRGNNGADALAAGRMLIDAGFEVDFLLICTEHGKVPKKETSSLPGGQVPAGSPRQEPAIDTQLRILNAYGRMVPVFTEEWLSVLRPDIIIDGIFGTGLARDVSGIYADAVRQINLAGERFGSRIVSVDIPSGVDGTTGRIRGCAVRADVTVTFAYYKRGHFLYPGCTLCGRLVRCEIGITDRSLVGRPGMFTFLEDSCRDLLPPRPEDGNKGTFGKVLAAAGSMGVSGACTMCAQAVLRMGAGMVKIYTHESGRVILQQTVPEAMCSVYGDRAEHPCGSPAEGGGSGEGCGPADAEPGRLLPSELEQLRRDLDWSDVAAVGPGMGLRAQSLQILETVLEYAASCGTEAAQKRRTRRFGLVLDADAIRLIAQNDLYDSLRAAGLSCEVILTPHMAECAALLHMNMEDLKAQLPGKAKEFADRYSCTLLLKDARTLAASCESAEMYLNTSGNNGLSTAGSGDVLTGITASCLAQYLAGKSDAPGDSFADPGESRRKDGFRAACAASYIHGRAAEAAEKEMGRRSLCATDLIHVLQDL